MARVNPVVLIQLLMQYHSTQNSRIPRTFIFSKNNRLHIHKETDEEVRKRKSFLSMSKITASEEAIQKILKKSLHGKVGKVFISPEMKKIAVPLQTATGQTGYGILPTGSRIDIPEGTFVRAFTYWEKVNDIDLSCFAIDANGNQEEFSWRNMYRKQNADITFSGDQTSGYNGGSEYLDINIDLFKKNRPNYRYLVFCNNVYSNLTFDKCECFAGFMIRDEDPKKVPLWKGEAGSSGNVLPLIFDPKTVATSFRINADSTFAYLFAIDLENREMIWLNISRSDRIHVAGSTSMDFLTRYFHVAKVFSVADLFEYAGEVVDKIEDADIILTDHEVPGILRENQKIIAPWNIEEIMAVMSS